MRLIALLSTILMLATNFVYAESASQPSSQPASIPVVVAPPPPMAPPSTASGPTIIFSDPGDGVDKDPLPADGKPPMFEITDVTAEVIGPLIKKIKVYDEKGIPEIWIRIDTYGGSIQAGFDMIHAIEGLHAKSVCVVDGKAMSMGFYILQTCNRRLMTKRAVLMAHEPSTSAGGKASELINVSEALVAYNDGFIEQCLSRMDINESTLRSKIANHDWYLNWHVAKEFKAIDDTIEVKDLPRVIAVPAEKSLLEELLGGKSIVAPITFDSDR